MITVLYQPLFNQQYTVTTCAIFSCVTHVLIWLCFDWYILQLKARYIGQFSAGTELPDLGDHFLMVPNAAKLRYDVRTHPQVKVSFHLGL